MKKLRNKFEVKVDRQLRRSRLKYEYETEKLPYVLAKHYIPDFIVTTATGKLYIECKGYLRPADRSKLLAVKRQHPNKDIRILFYSFSRVNIRWAERNGFRYAISDVPKEWLDGL